MKSQYKYTFVSDLKADFSVQVVGDDRMDAMRRYWEKDLGNKIQRLLEDSGLFELVRVDVSTPSRLKKIEKWSGL